MTVILVEHKVEWIAQFADRVIALKDGEILLDGNPSEVLTSPLLPENGFGISRYTSVARKAQEMGLWNGEKLPDHVGGSGGRISVPSPYGRRARGEGKMKIEIKDLHFTYPTGVEALRGISLKIESGEQVAIIGQNGAGKTTLVKHFNGLLQPTKGHVSDRGLGYYQAFGCKTGKPCWLCVPKP